MQSSPRTLSTAASRATRIARDGLRRGDLFEIKAGKWGWEFLGPNEPRLRTNQNQVKNQNQAVVAEGRVRKIYYCVPNAIIAGIAIDEFGDYKNSRFLVCR